MVRIVIHTEYLESNIVLYQLSLPIQWLGEVVHTEYLESESKSSLHSTGCLKSDNGLIVFFNSMVNRSSSHRVSGIRYWINCLYQFNGEEK